MAEVKRLETATDVETTRDALHAGRVVLVQPARGHGYRANVDALHLAAFAGGRGTVRHAWDLGAGVGAVGLSLLFQGSASRVTFVERDPFVASLAESNLIENGWRERGTVLHADVASGDMFPRGEADLVVSNPPYVPEGRGRPPKAATRSARSGDVLAFLACARVLLARRGRAVFVYPAVELVSFLSAARSRGLEPKRLRFVHGRSGDVARIVLLELAAGKPGGLVVDPPLVEG